MNELLALFRSIPGAISVTEALALYDVIYNKLSTKEGDTETFVDFGSHAGKSSLIAITALSDSNRKGKFYMIDPVFNPNNSFKANWDSFKAPTYLGDIKEKVTQFSINIEPIMIGETSEIAVTTLNQLEISYAFIDTADHGKEILSVECGYLKNRMKKGGLIVFHDYENQFTATTDALKNLVDSNLFVHIPIDWEPIIQEVLIHNLEVDNNSWHMPGHSHPNFIGVVRRKGAEIVTEE